MSLAQARKAAASGIFLLGAVAALVLNNYDPNFTEATVALSGAVISTIGVWAAKNHTVDDLSKSVAQLQAAALFVAGFFTEIPTSTVEKITILAGAVISVLVVFQVYNEEPVAEVPVAQP